MDGLPHEEVRPPTSSRTTARAVADGSRTLLSGNFQPLIVSPRYSVAIIAQHKTHGPTGRQRVNYYALSAIIQTVAAIIALFTDWNQRVRSALGLIAIAGLVFMPAVLHNFRSRSGRQRILAASIALVSLIAITAAAISFFRTDGPALAPASILTVRARTLALAGTTIEKHGLAETTVFSQDTTAAGGDTVEWELRLEPNRAVQGDATLSLVFPTSVTPVRDEQAGTPIGDRELLIVGKFERRVLTVRGVVDSSSAACPSSEFLRATVAFRGQVLAVALAPVAIFNVETCKTVRTNGTGYFYPGDRTVWDWNIDKTGPTSVAVLNSYVNTPFYGDERAFVDARLSSDLRPGRFSNLTPVSAFGDLVTVRAYVINDANEHVAPLLIAKDVRVRFFVPSGSDKTLRVRGYISSSNTDPAVVEDTTDFISDLPFRLEYVPGSAKVEGSAFPNGRLLSDDLIAPSGALVGTNDIDGNLLPDFSAQLFVTMQLRILSG